MGKTIGELVSFLEDRVPSATAEKWDNVGLLVGDSAWETRTAVVAIDLTEQALKKAEKSGAKLIVTHHPCIFPRSAGLARVTADSRHGTDEKLPSLIIRAIRQGIAIACAHTNFDQCALEVPEQVARGLGIKPQGRLIEKPNGSLLKLVVFVPSSHLAAVRDSLSAAGAGHIGNYDACTFSGVGEGTFRGTAGTSPFIGKPGKLEKTEEYRVETIFPRGLQRQVLRALFEAHPYEEVAYDLYPVEQGPAESGLVRGLGYGFWGDFSRPKTFSEVSRSVKSLFKLDGFWVTDPPPSRVKRVAFVAGKGSSFIEAALHVGCDLFITGEAGYHPALDGFRRGMAVMELGHRQSELFFLSTVRGWLTELGIRCLESGASTQKLC